MDKRSNATILTIQKERGKYELICSLGLPKHFDKIVVYCLLYKLYKDKKLNSYKLNTTRYEIAKNIFGGSHFGKNTYVRIMKALKVWKSVSINFEGVFYEGDAHTIRYFSVIDEVVLNKETGALMVRFSEAYIKQLKESKFYKLVDFEQYKKLHRASSARLYEILVKSFKGRKEWAINIQTLAEKMAFKKSDKGNEYYPSIVLRNLKPSVNEINKKTELCISLQYNNDTNVCIFKMLRKQDTFVPSKRVVGLNKKTMEKKMEQRELYLNYYRTLSEEDKNEILYGIEHDYLVQVLDTQEDKIFAYMCKNKQWQTTI